MKELHLRIYKGYKIFRIPTDLHFFDSIGFPLPENRET
jgi:hypothetical protein